GWGRAGAAALHRRPDQGRADQGRLRASRMLAYLQYTAVDETCRDRDSACAGLHSASPTRLLLGRHRPHANAGGPGASRTSPGIGAKGHRAEDALLDRSRHMMSEVAPVRRGPSMASAAAILMVGFVLSRLLGLVRVSIQ